MNPNNLSPLPEPTEAEIQHKAYQLWLEGGCREGSELDNWFAAKELLLHHHGRVLDSRRKSAKKLVGVKVNAAMPSKTLRFPAVA